MVMTLINPEWRVSPGGPVAMTCAPRQGAQVQPLVRELDPTLLRDGVCMPQLRSGATK